MSETDVRPNAMMRFVERHNNSFAAMSKSARRIKIEENHTWRLRLLPVAMGKDKEPFVDIAQHWWNKTPITCPIHTGESWGGSPDAYCPVCEISQRLRESQDKEINDIGYRSRCNLKIRAWCIVLDMEDNRGNVEDCPISEILNPYEFDMFKTTWEQFSKFQKWSMSRLRRGQQPSEYGLLDLESGADLLATQTAKGVSLDRMDPSPIFDLNDKNFDTYIQKIWSRLHPPQISIPNEKELMEVAAKIEEYAEHGGRRSGGGGRGRGRYEEDEPRGRGRRARDEDADADRGSRRRFREDTEDDSPRGRRASRQEEPEDVPPPTSSRRRQEPEPEPEPEPERQPPPRRASAPAAEQEPAQAPPPTRRREAPAQQEPEAEAQQEPEAEPAAPPPPTRRSRPAEPAAEEPAPPPPPRRGTNTAASAPPPPRRESAAANNSDADGDLGPQKPPTRRAPAQQGVDEEEDNVPEERRDPAPTARNAQVEEPPPSVGASGPPPTRAPAGEPGDLKNRLQRLNQRKP